MNNGQRAVDFADADRRKANPSRWEASKQVSPTLFDGATFNAEKDEIRLSGQMAAVYACMVDQEWRTLAEIRAFIKSGSEAGISARLRDLRKERWGRHTVNRRRRGNGEDGLFEYQLVNSATAVKAVTSEAQS